jgi:hypothetical protein
MTPLVAMPNGGVSSYTQIRICIKIESVRAGKEISRSNITIRLLCYELTWDRRLMHHSTDAQVHAGPRCR